MGEYLIGARTFLLSLRRTDHFVATEATGLGAEPARQTLFTVAAEAAVPCSRTAFTYAGVGRTEGGLADSIGFAGVPVRQLAAGAVAAGRVGASQPISTALAQGRIRLTDLLFASEEVRALFIARARVARMCDRRAGTFDTLMAPFPAWKLVRARLSSARRSLAGSSVFSLGWAIQPIIAARLCAAARGTERRRWHTAKPREAAQSEHAIGGAGTPLPPIVQWLA